MKGHVVQAMIIMEDTNCDNLIYKGNCEEIVEDFLSLKEDNPVTESEMKSQEDTSAKPGGDTENDSTQTEPIEERCAKGGRKKGETKSILEERHKARLEEQERKLIGEGVRRSQRIKERNDANSIMEIDHYIPENFKEAIDSGERNEWHKAMEEELSEIEKHKVWTLVPRENGMKVINSKWVYSTKKSSNDGIYKRKARLVAVRCNQRYGVDYKESFSPVLKKESLRTIVALATQHNLIIKTYDVKTAYLYGKCWNKKINEILYQLGMIRTKCDPCVYKLQRGEEFGLEECNSVQTPGDQNQNLDEYLDSKPVDKTVYQEMIGSLMYLTTGTRPDISFNVSNLSQYNDLKCTEEVDVEECFQICPEECVRHDYNIQDVERVIEYRILEIFSYFGGLIGIWIGVPIYAILDLLGTLSLVEVYGEKCMDVKNVRKWCREFSEGWENVHDEQRSGRPSLPESRVARIDEMVRNNRRITLHEILEGLNEECGYFFVQNIVSEVFGYKKVSARWVPKKLKAEKIQDGEVSGKGYGNRFLRQERGSSGGFHAERNNDQLRKVLLDSQETSACHPKRKKRKSNVLYLPMQDNAGKVTQCWVLNHQIFRPNSSAIGLNTLPSMFERFDENLENVENYIYRLKQFMLISKTKEDFKTPFLISCIGPKYFSILRNLVFPEEVDQVPFDKLCRILLKHFNPKTNIIYERFVFQKMDQKSGEAISKYIIRLKERAQRCNFGDFLQESLRDRFVAGIIDTPTQKKLLQEEGLTFEGALDIALSAESADNDLHNLKRSEDAHRSPQHLHAINNPCKHCEFRLQTNIVWLENLYHFMKSNLNTVFHNDARVLFNPSKVPYQAAVHSSFEVVNPYIEGSAVSDSTYVYKMFRLLFVFEILVSPPPRFEGRHFLQPNSEWEVIEVTFYYKDRLMEIH
ncbi:hypothetical protein LAZ67_20001822 [Cordylochernes scorpioides]|uniref:Reverse transcriptase Ty1/copia-type domain-containing protein n=1 Tax=Cordylochernes scorpioides TaxID=51811 RepID=A0ABY6LLA5_9ARAC|nr:hypothetical protein LAZ67_20001822 [Cordylochernes scorpioides]